MTQSISAWGWAYAVDACDTGPKSHRSRMLTQCTVTMLTACICIASSGHKAVQSCQEVAILSTVLAHAHLHRSTSTSSCLACHVTDQPTMSTLAKHISRDVFDDNSAESAQLQADGFLVDVPVKLCFQYIGKNGYYQLFHYTTLTAYIAEPHRNIMRTMQCLPAGVAGPPPCHA
jgi:hypothetical protein